MGFKSVILSGLARVGPRPLAAIWFTAFGFLATFLFFLPLSSKSHVVILYILLPSISAGIAGYILGGAILDSPKIKSYSDSLLRGIGVTALAYAIFSMLYVFTLPFLEPGWSMREAVGLIVFPLVFGLLMMGPLASIAGMIAGVTLFRFGRRLFNETDGRSSEKAIV
ncbi:MAG TPA: hypothetical protein VG759_07540 [Candidatus Angelobacter sp.]|jgi:hypothetical protein|nr:hypothetical protein [Candidatus Angelobacter sp.]